MDFYQIRTKETKDGLELYPDFVIGRSKDLMVRGRAFYAIWDEAQGLWSQDEYDVQRLVDEELQREADKLFSETGVRYSVRYLSSFNSASWMQFRKYVQNLGDNSHPLNSTVLFANSNIKKTDYASRRLPYNLCDQPIPAWEELVSTLYSPDERAKIEWAIGSIISGDSKSIQKFIVFYGSAGTGKSTMLNIIGRLFDGYTTAFDGRALGSSNATFATEVFNHNPLVAIQHDGDLSRIDDNTRLNSIISHESMTMNEKYKASYTAQVNAMLFIGSNQPVKITDAKSGIIRRLIDVHPTGVRFPIDHYNTLMGQVEFELGGIASHCLDVYRQMGKNYYNHYRPLEMMLQTDVFFNFIEAYYDIFKKQDKTTLKQAYTMYKEYCSENGIDRPLPQYKMREELRNYFDEFKDRSEVDGESVRSVYVGFSAEKFKEPKNENATVFSLVVEEEHSLLDEELGDHPAQLAKADGTPRKKWENVTTCLLDIDTRELHWVKVDENHVVVDFDLQDMNGMKSLERNLEAASQWPATYAELSRSGNGVHLHYFYDGDISQLANEFADGIEIKTYSGNGSLRRKLSKCNSVPIAHISSGLPLKEKEKEPQVLKEKTITSETGLRRLIERNLRKEIHPGTKPSVDFIHKVLEDAYESGMSYDVSDMRPRILAFANNSSHQAGLAIKTVQTMKFKSEEELNSDLKDLDDSRLVFFDCEVYPNLFVICWKYQGDDTVVKMINPKPHEVEALFKLKLIGFYNRRYDNHIIYAASMGYSNADLFKLSQRIAVDNDMAVTFASAYNLSYADVWDFSTLRQGLKAFEIDLEIHHMELDLPWDQPVDESHWEKVLEYCANDVVATEAVFESRKEDFIARKILAELSGLTVNDTTQRHTAKIIFGDDRHPQKKFKYTNLAEEFPGYVFELGKSTYKGEDPGEGGYVYAEPGMYSEVALLDVASMHPTSICVLDLFGPYTERFHDLLVARMAIKNQDYEVARTALGGKLAQFLGGVESDPGSAKALAYSLKIAINIVYGLTSAKFDNPFRDIRNVDNIVAKRGALFMIDLKEEIQKRGYTVAHIKTDSVKIPNADQEIIDFVIEFGNKYGYSFEHEVTYDKFCLVNDAVYIARKGDEWTAVGAQYQHPFVFKTLFSGEEPVFNDFCERRSVVQGTMYLDLKKGEERDYHNMRYLGRTGNFVPVLKGGGILYRVKDDKYYAVSATKGHEWIEADIARERPTEIDMSYFEKLVQDARKNIEQFGPFEELTNGSR